MTENARKKVERAEKRAKKRKSEGKESSRKKSKKSSSDALKSALTKDAQVRAGSKPIFVQPPNLSKECTLKDYQLEGVRWLASLFENGVSGILADEVSKSIMKTTWNFCAPHFLHLELLSLNQRWVWVRQSK